MSIISFLKRFWLNIKSLFDSFPSSIKTAVHIGVTVTESVKLFVDSPLADALTAIIPGNIDDTIKQALRKELPTILINLKLADDCGQFRDAQQITKCAIQTLQNLDSSIKSSYLHNLSVLIAQLASDSKLSWSDGVCIVEWYYQQRYKKA
ncbi:hypothetical protein [Mucilaginibacter glaciei]|uniref:Uncharacterized protein n=1 Tax=Mucilaginibacter glaciei TaxID=2772109 RepID=A0A926NRD4_9SPHI|nr:hypothetical protein [Mucilaginibacter glaciei]MBD1394621.1 hypothetical protein [Mucilaginibacter glaciei]